MWGYVMAAEKIVHIPIYIYLFIYVLFLFCDSQISPNNQIPEGSEIRSFLEIRSPEGSQILQEIPIASRGGSFFLNVSTSTAPPSRSYVLHLCSILSFCSPSPYGSLGFSWELWGSPEEKGEKQRNISGWHYISWSNKKVVKQVFCLKWFAMHFKVLRVNVSMI